MDELPDVTPEPGTIETRELVVDDAALVKAFFLGPGAELDTHDHPESLNVFHVLAGTVTVIQEDEEEEIVAPGVVHHERGVAHGARNDTDETAAFTATLAPLP
ncbi:cupin domain-containing protein [Halolamina sp. CBA1230]|uniref:cupin domain-containing protein n=1 Tax=Halolamina sp. CBA1230 TaxID=1853690 RepID=UPI0009A2129F|nr:cupin domain-containing protein [Halolamina sp. CBA1230]QKY20268.1 cupin domain-containing protein [Halolamina sp. CBA1230]